MRILLGTTNLSKIRRFRDLLQEYDAELLTLYDLQVEGEPEETGRDPVENAVQKAYFYGKLFDRHRRWDCHPENPLQNIH